MFEFALELSIVSTLFYYKRYRANDNEIVVRELLSALLQDILHECTTTEAFIERFQDSHKHNEWISRTKALIERMQPVNGDRRVSL